MSIDKSDLEEIEVVLHHQTERAYLVSDDGHRENAVWIPKSLCELEKISPALWKLTASEETLADKGLA